MEAKIEQLIDKAIAMCEERQRRAPDFEIYNSIIKQLHYMRYVFSGKEGDRSKLKDIIIGRYAAFEFEASDPEFADVLADVQYIASQSAKGLKVDLA